MRTEVADLPLVVTGLFLGCGAHDLAAAADGGYIAVMRVDAEARMTDGDRAQIKEAARSIGARAYFVAVRQYHYWTGPELGATLLTDELRADVEQLTNAVAGDELVFLLAEDEVAVRAEALRRAVVHCSCHRADAV